MPATTSFFTQREIGTALNNAVVFASKPNGLGEIKDTRRQILREYTQALIEPAMEHLREDLLTSEELVFALSSAAMFIHMKEVMKTYTLPMADTAKFMMTPVLPAIKKTRTTCTTCGQDYYEDKVNK